MGIGGINQLMQGQGGMDALGVANPFGGAQLPGLNGFGLDQAGLGGLAGGGQGDLTGVIQQVIQELEQLLQQLGGGQGQGQGQGAGGAQDPNAQGNGPVDQKGGININGNGNTVEVCCCGDKGGANPMDSGKQTAGAPQANAQANANVNVQAPQKQDNGFFGLPLPPLPPLPF